MYHYTYEIISKASKANKKYIGVRSSKVQPINDIGIKYFTASTDFKDNPSSFHIRVLKIFKTRQEAILLGLPVL